ncbi:MAG: hypothetical protein ACYDAY_01520 [Candidatus Dormibacteria bacterium]
MASRSVSAACILAAVLAAGAFGSARAGTTLPVPSPPVPLPSLVPGSPQGRPVAPCSFSPLGATEIRTLFSRTSGSVMHAALDPFDPCHIVRSEGSVVSRSDDSGQSFAPIFDGSSAGGVGVAGFEAGLPAFATGHAFHFADVSGGAGMFHTSDEGASFQHASGNFAPSNDHGGVRQVVFAPSNPQYGYAISEGVAGRLLQGTTDGGNSWSVLPSPSGAVSTVAVDPSDPRHVFAADGGLDALSQGNVQQPSALPGSVFLESSDAGQTWTTRAGPADGSPGLLAAGRGSGSLFLYAIDVGNTASGSSAAPVRTYEVWVSVDDGATWIGRPVATLDGNGPVALTVLPGNGAYAALAGRLASTGALWVEATGSAFANGAGRPFGDLVGATQLDLQGSRALAAGGAFALSVLAGSSGSHVERMFAFTQVSLAPPPPPPAGVQLVALRVCNLTRVGPGAGVPPPAPDPGVSNSSNHKDGTYHSGALAYDGRYLWYTDTEADPGELLSLDPATAGCQPGPRLEIPASATAGALQGFRAIAYDPRYLWPSGRAGALLVQGDSDPQLPDPHSNLPIWAIDTVTGQTMLATYVFAPPYQAEPGPVPGSSAVYVTSNRDPTSMTYDQYRDRLWGPVADGSGAAVPGLLQLPAVPGGPPLAEPTCMSHLKDDSSLGGSNLGPSAYVIGAPNLAYVQDEDDATVLEVDPGTCHSTGAGKFVHSPYSEGYDENDQVACDPLTFGLGSVSAGESDTSALWIRNVRQNQVTAFAIPGSWCPLLSRLSADPVAPTLAGQPAQVCGTLTGFAGSGPPLPIATETLDFSIPGGGRASGVTDSAGRACAEVATPPSAGLDPVEVRFAGSHRYVAATATTTVQVYTNVLPPAVAGIPGLFLRPPNPPPPPVPQPFAAPQPAPQAQAQTQVQSQAQAQSQPGLMSQRQRQSQLAVQRASGGLPGEETTTMQAVVARLGRDGPLLWMQQLTAAALFAVALTAAWRRTRTAPRPALQASPAGGRRARRGQTRTRTRRRP